MEKTYNILEYFRDVDTTKEHEGYFCSVGEALCIVILGSFCGLRNVKQISQWADDNRTKDFLYKYFGISKVPCYYWLLCLLKLIVPESLNQCFISWVNSLLPATLEGYTAAFDGKSIRSTCKMKDYDNPLHIVSAHIAELGITFGQKAVYEKSNEIPAVRDLIRSLKLEGCIVVADALNCQKETAQAAIDADADYLLNVKDNQETLKQDIEDYVQDDELRKTMDTADTREKNRGRIEFRRAFVTNDIDWLFGKEEWVNLACIGAINRQVTTPNGTTNEWHYYISSRNLSAEELLKYARLEWSVESMHWLLDVHFAEDFCRIHDKNLLQNLNMVRKMVLNSVKQYKEKYADKRPLSSIMFDCLLDPINIIPFWGLDEN